MAFPALTIAEAVSRQKAVFAKGQQCQKLRLNLVGTINTYDSVPEMHGESQDRL